MSGSKAVEHCNWSGLCEHFFSLEVSEIFYEAFEWFANEENKMTQY